MSLLARLVLLVAVALAPAVVVEALFVKETSAARQVQAREEAMRLARLATSDLQSVLDGAGQIVEAMSRLSLLRVADMSRCRPYLADLVATFPRYANIAAADATGRIFCNSGDPVENDISDRLWFRAALAADHAVVGEFVEQGRASGRPSLHVARAIREVDGTPIAVVAAALDLGWLAERLAAVSLPPGAAAFVADRSGVVLAGSPDGADFLGQRMEGDLAALLQRPAPAVEELPGLDGRLRIQAYLPPGAVGGSLFVSVGLDSELLLASLRNADRRSRAVIVAGLLFSALLALGLGRWSVRQPMDALLGAAHRWQQGDFSARTSLPRDSRSEFSQLGAAFDAVADAVEIRERALRAALAAGQMGTWDWHIATDRMTWDERQFELFGMDPAAGPPGVAEVVARIHPEDRPRLMQAISAAQEAGQGILNEEFRLCLPGGQVRWVGGYGHAVPGPDGRAIRVVGLNFDITARREAEERLRALFEASPVAFAVIDPDSLCVLDANARASATLGYAREELIGLPLPRIDPAMDQVALAARLRAANASGASLEFEARHRMKSGELRDVLVRAESPIVNGRMVIQLAWVDVTDRRRAEAALAHSEERLRAVLDNVPVGVLLAEAPSGRIVLGNRRIAEILRWPMRYLQDAEAFREWEGYHPDGRRVADDEYPLLRALAGEEAPALECRFRRGDGSFAWMRAAATPVRDPATGDVTGAVVLLADVDSERSAAEALAESERRFRDLADHISQFAWMADETGAVFWFNKRWYEYTGTNLEEMQGRGWQKLQHPDHAERVIARLQRCWEAGEPWEDTFPLRGRDGGYRWFLTRAQPIRDEQGYVVRWFGTNTDVTEQREAEAQLRLALEAGEIGAFEWDLCTDARHWDERMRAIWGLPPGIPGSRDAFHAGVHPEDAARVETAIAAALDPSGNGHYQAEYRVIGVTDGMIRHVVVRGRTEFAAGRAVHMIGTAVDVTPLRRAAEVLAREAEQLEHLAEERARALAESEARLAQAARMEALGRLAGGIAHDFNNVLQAVQGGLVLATKRLPNDPEGARRFLQLATEAVGRGASVTGRLLSFARRVELRAEPVAAAPMLADLAEMLRPALGPAVTLRVEAPPGLPPLYADRGQLEAVLVNLANNARDAMPRGGALTLHAEAISMPGADGAPPGLVDGTYVRLSVTDRGEGMTPDVLARVTEPFFTTKPKGKGTGLGLAMARGFTEQSGGGLSIRSAPGRGTTVSLWLPRAAAQAGPRAANDVGPISRAGQGAAVVLLAEDEPEVRAVLRAELEDQGYRVTAAPDAKAALEALDDGLRPDALVTDLAMPGGLDGLDLVQAARRRLPRLPAVLVTGHAGEAVPSKLDDAERSGPFALLRKPAAPEVLRERLARVLGRG